ncbi:hypothetical protein GE118_04200 [Mycoplasma sp. NEAQ87857]|uniref:hypothetical protein n=1 Tax=Mycoplasma sp. NEAQ87857 TaxID=2683967 RepID=UPI001316B084|nr:hypothetical protein [Mycoplasma sp. NEAQ87857]QGZ97978.1 hypothetical protein GE118_04200 [Mycoplasma sp. NEAQ87857]
MKTFSQLKEKQNQLSPIQRDYEGYVLNPGNESQLFFDFIKNYQDQTIYKNLQMIKSDSSLLEAYLHTMIYTDKRVNFIINLQLFSKGKNYVSFSTNADDEGHIETIIIPSWKKNFIYTSKTDNKETIEKVLSISAMSNELNELKKDKENNAEEIEKIYIEFDKLIKDQASNIAKSYYEFKANEINVAAFTEEHFAFIKSKYDLSNKFDININIFSWILKQNQAAMQLVSMCKDVECNKFDKKNWYITLPTLTIDNNIRYYQTQILDCLIKTAIDSCYFNNTEIKETDTVIQSIIRYLLVKFFNLEINEIDKDMFKEFLDKIKDCSNLEFFEILNIIESNYYLIKSKITNYLDERLIEGN